MAAVGGLHPELGSLACPQALATHQSSDAIATTRATECLRQPRATVGAPVTLKLLADSVRKSLYDLKRRRDRELSTEEKIRRLRESYEKFPVQEDEFCLDDETIQEVWKDI